MFDLVAVLIALGLLMYLAYRGVTLLILAPAMALLAALLTGGLPILGAYQSVDKVQSQHMRHNILGRFPI
jgi:H+/gluconate symporter-like permease